MTREEAKEFIAQSVKSDVDMAKVADAIKALEQEPCNDAISRQTVLDMLEDINAEIEGVGFYYEHYVEYIKKLPPVKPQEPKWVSVRERLPEDGQSVLFCDIDNDIMVGYHVEGRPDTHFSQDGTYEDMKNVRAWMPLPTPYESQERSDKG